MENRLTDYEQYYVLLSHNMVELPSNAPTWSTMREAMLQAVRTNVANHKALRNDTRQFGPKNGASQMKAHITAFKENTSVGKNQAVYDGLLTYAKVVYAAILMEDYSAKFYEARSTAELDMVVNSINATMNLLKMDMPGTIMLPGISGIVQPTAQNLKTIDMQEITTCLKAFSTATEGAAIGTHAENVAKTAKDLLWSNVICTPDTEIPGDVDIDDADITDEDLEEEGTAATEEESAEKENEQGLVKKAELTAAFESSLAPLGKIAAELSDLIGDSITEGSPAGFGIYANASAGGSELYCISAKSDGGLTTAPFTLSPDLDPTVKASVIADVKQTDYLIQQQLNQYERNMTTETEDLAASLASKTPGYWLNYILTLTTGYVSCLKGKYNLKAAAKAGIIKLNASETRVSSAADIKSYIYWSLSEMIIDTALQKGIQPGQLSMISAYADECINYVLSQALQTYIRTYVQLAKRKNNYGKKVPKTGTILLVHFGTAYQDENALEALQANLEATFTSRGGLVDVSPVQGDNLYSVSISVQPYGEVTDPDFLGNHLDQVRDNIWSGNLLLGVNNNRAYYLPFDLENDQTTSKHLFTMYAASRAGKGNLTLTILAQALKAGIDIAYVDCKPETGVALGQIAWLNNMEAFVFNGTGSGLAPYSGPMESHAGQMRTNYLELAGSVPSVITKTVAEKLRTFIPYIKSLYLCMLASRLRAEQPGTYAKNSSLWVFDEVQSASSLEKELNRLLDDELKDLKTKQKVKKGETVPEGVNEAIAYIEAYEKLKKAISTQITEFSTKNLGKAKMTVFFIFQEPSWIKENQKGPGSLIADFVEMIGGNSTKLIGRNAVKAACGPYGYAGVLSKPWYKQICATASWALYEGAVGHGEVPPTLIFKPYDVWGCPLGADKEAQSPSEMQATLASEDGLRYFQRVVQELVGLDVAAQTLNRTYAGMLPIVQSFTDVPEVKNYVYSVECTSELNPAGSQESNPTIDVDVDTFNDFASNTASANVDMSMTGTEQPITPIAERARAEAEARANDPFAQFGSKRQTLTPEEIMQITQRPNVGTNGLNVVDRSEFNSASPLQARDNATATNRNEKGEVIINDTQIRPENIKPINNTNYVRTSVQISDSLFQTDNLRKIAKSLYNIWEQLLKAIVKQCGGKGAVKMLYIDQSYIVVNGKLVDHGCLENNFINGLDEIAYMPDILRLFPALTELLMAEPMLDLLNEQLDEAIIKKSVKAGKELTLPEYLFKTYPTLNKVVNTTSKHAWSRRDLLSPTKDRSERIKQQLDEQRARKEQGNAIQRIRSTYSSKHSTGTADKAERVKRARNATKKKKYRGGVFGWIAYNGLLKHL